MGMLFNTAATREMLNRVNEAFSEENFDDWRNSNEFDGLKELQDIAFENGIVPAGARKRARWKHWLKKILHQEPAPRNLAYVVDTAPTTFACGGRSNVGRELTRLFQQAIADANCAEIAMVIQPDTRVCITQAQTIPLATKPGRYTLAITLSTYEVPQILPPEPAKRVRSTKTKDTRKPNKSSKKRS